MNTNQINYMGRLVFGHRYLGTFSLDKVPPRFKPNCNLQYFIINTDTSNLPGKHWIAISVHNNKTAHIFDSFGIPPPPLLVKQLKLRGINKIYYSTRQVQPFESLICGQLALKHLANVDLRGRARGVSRWKTVLH